MGIPLEKKTGTNFGPPGNSKLVYFLDDLNLPEVGLQRRNHGMQSWCVRECVGGSCPHIYIHCPVRFMAVAYAHDFATSVALVSPRPGHKHRTSIAALSPVNSHFRAY